MKLLEMMYRSFIGRYMSFIAKGWRIISTPRMLYGYLNVPNGQFNKYTRISSSAVLMNRERISIEDNVWVWHYSILDGTNGLTIRKGCQVGAWVGIFTHGSETSIRLLGARFVHVPNEKRIGYSKGSVYIGEYTFIGASSIILPGVNIGKGCIIAAGTLIRKNIPDYSIVAGWPGKLIGSTLDIDRKFLLENDLSSSYYDQEQLIRILKSG